jgi:hypothetical protein
MVALAMPPSTTSNAKNSYWPSMDSGDSARSGKNLSVRGIILNRKTKRKENMNEIEREEKQVNKKKHGNNALPHTSSACGIALCPP